MTLIPYGPGGSPAGTTPCSELADTTVVWIGRPSNVITAPGMNPLPATGIVLEFTEPTATGATLLTDAVVPGLVVPVTVGSNVAVEPGGAVAVGVPVTTGWPATSVGAPKDT